jgi:hypothetical protein
MSKHTKPIDLKDSDWLVFYRDLYLGFGSPDSLVLRCARRAYRDFNRTWHGARDPAARREERRTAGLTTIVDAVSSLQNRRLNARSFDIWHTNTMAALISATDPATEGTGLTLGQAQKWINMSLKYAIGSRVPGMNRVEPLAHIPIDRIVLAQLGRDTAYQSALKCLPDGARKGVRSGIRCIRSRTHARSTVRWGLGIKVQRRWQDP